MEDGDVVVAEGKCAQRNAGDFLYAVSCDVFVMERGKIRRLITYFVQVG